jgi:predicted metal-dependent phosphoesterase TrpH
MVAQAIEVGLQGLVFTEHHIVWPKEELDSLQARFPEIKLFRGIEVTAADGNDYLIYGVTEPDVFQWGMGVRELLKRAHAHGGVVVMAHPYRFRQEELVMPDDEMVDGVEIGSNNMINHAHLKACKLAERWGATAVMSSDAHHVNAVGLYGVRFDHAIADEQALVEALKRREFRRFADVARLTALNDEILSYVPEVTRLLALGYDDRAVQREMPLLGLAAIEGIRNGWDIRKPI